MKKLLAIFLSALLTCGLAACGGGGGGGGGGGELSLISCPEQGFTTKVDPSYTWETDEAEGLTIYMEDKGSMPYVRISWFDDVDSADDACDYMSENIRPVIQESNPDGAFQASESSETRIGGKKLPVGEYIYEEQGQKVTMKLAFDTTGDHTVVYQAKYLSDEGEETLDTLENAIRNFKAGDKPKTANANPDLLRGISAGKVSGNRDYDNEDEMAADNEDERSAYTNDEIVAGINDEEDDGLSLISCPEQGFTTKADSSYPWKYVEGDGITIWTMAEGSIPYVLVYQTNYLNDDSYRYICDEFTPQMQEEYGNDLLNYEEYRDYEIGGKKLPAGLYTYKNSQGYTLEMLRVDDSTGQYTVQYTAKYQQGYGDATLEALDTAIRNFKSDKISNNGNTDSAGIGSSQSGGGNTGNAGIGSSRSGGGNTGNAGIGSSRSGSGYTGNAGIGSNQTGSNNRISSVGQYKIIPAESKTLEYERYENGLISMDIPKGWKVDILSQAGDYIGYGFSISNPNDTRYGIIFYRTMGITYTGPFSDNERAAQFFNKFYGVTDDIIVNPVTVEGFFRAICNKLNMKFEIVEDLGSAQSGKSGTLRAMVTDVDGNTDEGIFSTTLQTINFGHVYDILNNNEDLGDYNLLYAFGVTMITAPEGELVDWADQLIHCISSITYSSTFTEGYNSQWKQIIDTGNVIMQSQSEISDIIVSGWEERQSTYDIISQKQSDVTLGYERIYDTETGEIYKAYNGFIDDISTDNYMSERYQPITDDMYLSGIDGYIEK